MSNAPMPAVPLVILSASLFLDAAMSAQEHQLVVEIRSERGDLRAGDEVPITFVVTNAGTGTYKYVDRNYDRSGRMGEYRLQAFDEQGAPVSDPRTTSLVPQGYMGGGLGTFAELPPGERFTKTVALNLWALVTAPGVYTVRGSYSLENGTTLESTPLTIRVVPRSEDEMGQYIGTLAAQLGRASEPEVRTRLIQRLMFTADRRAAQPLLDISDQDNNASFWIGEAFSYYLPKDGVLLEDAMATIRRHGVSPSSVRILEQLQAPRETIKELIGQSLIDANDGVRAEAALAAQNYPDDRFMERLIQLAMQGSAGTRVRAIYALVSNRTDAGIAALRRLRQDADPEIRTTTERAIESAYERSGAGPGRPLQMIDFPDIAKH